MVNKILKYGQAFLKPGFLEQFRGVIIAVPYSESSDSKWGIISGATGIYWATRSSYN